MDKIVTFADWSLYLWTAILAGAFFGLREFRFVINTSTSLPYFFFVWWKRLKPKHASTTVFNHPQHGLLIKIVLGTECDIICYDKNGILHVGSHMIGKPHAINSKGKKLTPIEAGIIPPGYIFLAGCHPQSLDSRYADVGLVKASELTGRCWGIWKQGMGARKI